MTLNVFCPRAALAALCLLAAVTRADAQTPQVPVVADSAEIPALEHDAVAPDPTTPAPIRVRHVEPVWPTPVTEPWRFRVHLVLEADGRVGTSRIVQVLVGDPKARPVGAAGEVDPTLRDSPTARAGLAVLAASRQWRFEKPRKVPMLIVTDIGVETATSTSPAPARTVTMPLRIGGSMPPPRKLRDVPPVYPPDAIAARVTGVVTIEATIGTTGAVEAVRVISGVPMLDEPALEAVRQWRYTPTLLNGVPVPVIMTVTLNFSLSQ